MKRAIVFIDGNNWYFKLRQLLQPANLKPRVDFDTRSFVADLVSPDTVAGIRYYIGQVRRVRNDEKK